MQHHARATACMSYLLRPAKPKMRGKYKVHHGYGGWPICGGGHDGTKVKKWKITMGPVDCQRCKSIFDRRNPPGQPILI